MDPLVVALGAVGLAWGVVADRVAARWPEHDTPGVRGVDWRTAVVGAFGALAMAGVASRFAEPVEVAIFGVYVLALVLLLATDLDQRLLPDLITYLLVPFAAVVSLAGLNPHVQGTEDLLGSVVAAIAFPVGLYLLSIPFGAGAIGMGDLKLMASVGLLAGFYRTFLGLLTGAFLSGIVIVALMALGRVGRRSYIPFGPFLIAGAVWGLLLRL